MINVFPKSNGSLYTVQISHAIFLRDNKISLHGYVGVDTLVSTVSAPPSFGLVMSTYMWTTLEFLDHLIANYIGCVTVFYIV